MKTALLLLGLFAIALAAPPKQDVIPRKYKVSDKVFLQRQYDILRIFKYINQPTYYKDFVDIAKTYTPDQYVSMYSKPEYFNDFWYYYQNDILPRGEIFSVFYEEQLKQAISLFKFFYYAKDYETFFKSAVWARQYVNEGMFIYAFSVAVIHRPDTYGIILPPIYEMYPYYFYNSEVINQAQQYKQRFSGVTPQAVEGYTGYTVYSNYSGYYLNLNPEQSLSYFTEDIGINAYYYYYNLYYPFWMNGKEFNLFNDKRGELYYFIHQQLLARYYLERLSNDFGEIPILKEYFPVKTGYYPSLEYPNGLQFPSRPDYADVNQYFESNPYYFNYTETYTYVQDYARRIRDAIDMGYVYTPEGSKVYLYESNGFETLGNLIQASPDSPNSRFYGALQMFMRRLFGYSYYPLNKYQIAPSVLEHFETSLRDPVFYQMYKMIIQYFQRYKNNLPFYTYSDLDFTGVKVESFQIDRLVTYFEPFYSDLSYGVYVNEKEFETGFPVRVQQYRLNHKQFSYTINVNSDKTTESVVKVFIGPKYDEYGREIDINENRLNFVLFDKFVYSLQSGKNAIVRSSRQSYFCSDRTSYQELYKRVFSAYKGTEEFQINGCEAYWAFPNRFLLPKGKYGGQTYQFYTIVVPYKPASTAPSYTDVFYPRVGTGGYFIDNRPFGYPFDRYIEQNSFYVPNSYFQDVVIYNKKFEDINVSTSQ